MTNRPEVEWEVQQYLQRLAMMLQIAAQGRQQQQHSVTLRDLGVMLPLPRVLADAYQGVHAFVQARPEVDFGGPAAERTVALLPHCREQLLQACVQQGWRMPPSVAAALGAPGAVQQQQKEQ